MYALAFLGRRSVLDILRGRRGAWCICAGSDVRFGVSGPPLCCLTRGRRGAWSICVGSDVRFGISGPPLCRCAFCVAGVGLGASARGLMYALAFLGRRSVLCFFWAAALLLGILRGRRGTWSICVGSDVRFGVSGPPLSRSAFCVAGLDLGASARGLMYALAFLGRRSAAVLFAWQAWDLEQIGFGVAVPIGAKKILR